MISLLFFTLPLLALASPEPAAVTPCTVGIDTPCLPSSTCTPTMISTSGKPWLGQCIATPTPIPTSPTPTPVPTTSVECHVGWANGGGCQTGSTCTPTETCYRLRPCGGACIPTATPVPTPPTSTECHVGWEGQCHTGSTCTPTMTCLKGRPCGGACIGTPTPLPPSSSPPIITDSPPTTKTECHVGWADGECNHGSTCTPTMTCQKGRPCGGACIATPTPPPTTKTECHVGWADGECNYGSTCTPTMTCVRGRPCGGACIATAPPPASSGRKA